MSIIHPSLFVVQIFARVILKFGNSEIQWNVLPKMWCLQNQNQKHVYLALSKINVFDHYLLKKFSSTIRISSMSNLTYMLSTFEGPCLCRAWFVTPRCICNNSPICLWKIARNLRGIYSCIDKVSDSGACSLGFFAHSDCQIYTPLLKPSG